MKRLLFVCTENANRSQMAEGFARHLGGSAIEAWSAGSQPSGTVNPKAIIAMRERGIDLSTHRSKSLDALPKGRWHAAITMGCGDRCPNLPAERREDWALADPRDLEGDAYAQVRDEIERRVALLVSELLGSAG